MVTSVTSLGRSGLSDWFIQRLTALVLLAYGIYLVAFIATNSHIDFAQWSAFFQKPVTKAFSFAALLSLAAHAWVGLWSVSTDYLTERTLGIKAPGLARRATFIRLLFQAVCAIIAFIYVLWGIQILWG